MQELTHDCLRSTASEMPLKSDHKHSTHLAKLLAIEISITIFTEVRDDEIFHVIYLRLICTLLLSDFDRNSLLSVSMQFYKTRDIC